jgi:hypothetical protein
MSSHFILGHHHQDRNPKLAYPKPHLHILLQNNTIQRLTSMMTIQLTYQSTPSQILLLTPDPVTIYAHAVPFALVENFLVYHVLGRFVSIVM